MKFLPIVCAILLPSVLSAAVSINPVADTFVTTGPSSNLGANNYGGAGALGVSGSSSAQGEFQSALRFDLSSALSSFNSTHGAGNWNITGITLQLTVTTPGNPIFNSNAAGDFKIDWMSNDSWVEGTGNPNTPTTTGLTFNSLSSFQSVSDETLGTFAFTNPSSGNQVWTLNLSSAFLADATAGGLVSLRIYAEDPTISYLFNSRSFGTMASRPLLTVTAIPEPGTYALAGLGLAFLIFFSRARLRRQ